MLIGAYLPFKTSGLQPDKIAAFQTALRPPSGAMPKWLHLEWGIAVGDSFAKLPNGDSILFSGHIDNRKDLRAQFYKPDASQAQLYADAYTRWGDAADLHVIGTFATIIVSKKFPRARLSASPNTCFPLHYYFDETQLIVASRVQALFNTGRVEKIVSEEKIADSLYLNYKNPEQGWFENIRRLPSGTRAHISPHGVKIERYYDVLSVPRVIFKDDRDYVVAADALFTEATHNMLDGFKSPAVSLSGGFDSQAVAAYTIRSRPDNPLRTYTSIPDDDWDGLNSANHVGNEQPYVRELSDMYPQIIPAWIRSSGKSFDYFQRDIFEFALQAPRNAMNLHWSHDIRQTAKADECDVILTGGFGNATLSYTGEHAYSGWLSRGQIKALLGEIARSGSANSIPRRVFSQALMPLLPDRIWHWIKKVRHSTITDPFQIWCPMNQGYAQDMQVAKRAADLGFDPTFRRPADSRLARASIIAMAGGEGADTMLAMSAIHSIPTRDPTSYRPFLEFCLGIPDNQYLRAGVKRWLAKRMLDGKIPSSVLNETRRGQQAADWHLRLLRQRNALIEEIDWLSEDPAMRHRLNLTSLRDALVNFPEKTPLDSNTSARLQLAVTRGLTTARFIRYLEGKNT